MAQPINEHGRRIKYSTIEERVEAYTRQKKEGKARFDAYLAHEQNSLMEGWLSGLDVVLPQPLQKLWEGFKEAHADHKKLRYFKRGTLRDLLVSKGWHLEGMKILSRQTEKKIPTEGV